MAERRMISKKIIHSDAFLDMPATSQNLYFHLLLEADDEGFVNSPRKIQRTVGASDGDAQILIAKKFILAFESGIVVIKHWRIHNYIQNDRFKPTSYIEERSMLSVEDNNGYKLDTTCTPSIGKDSIGEDRLGKNREEESMQPFSFFLSKETSFDKLSQTYKDELKAKIESENKGMSYQDFSDGLQMKAYKYKNFWLAYQNWCKKDYNKHQPTNNRNNINKAFEGVEAGESKF